MRTDLAVTYLMTACLAPILGLELGIVTTTAEAIAFGLFWPLFAIKYLAIGLWAVVYSGFTLLF